MKLPAPTETSHAAAPAPSHHQGISCRSAIAVITSDDPNSQRAHGNPRTTKIYIVESAPMRRAIVTGGTKGLGLAIARRLAADGLDVLALYAHDDPAAQACGLRVARCDVASATDVDALFAVERECDVLVHAAGFTRDKLMMMMPERDFDDVIGVHLKGAFLTAKQAMKPMISRRWGRIVLVVSPTALL